MMGSCIDLVHYVVVREDLSPGQQLAQAVHAAGESASPVPEPGTVAVVLGVRDEEALWKTYDRLTEAGVGAHLVIEPCGPAYCPCLGDGHACAIGVFPIPSADRKRVRAALGNLRPAGRVT